MNVEKLMVRDVRMCRPEDDLTVPAQIMWDKDCGVVPVVDAAGRVVGMITDRDICMGAYTQGRALADIRVDAVMSRKVHACRTSDELARAEELMRGEQVRRLPVVDAGGRLVGLISLNDLACEAASERPLRHKDVTLEEVAVTLATVCAHRLHAGEELVLQPAKRGPSGVKVGAAS